MTRYERFVPQGRASLVEDAPGWSDGPKNRSTAEASTGPVCWKCRGNGAIKSKKAKVVSNSSGPVDRVCPVCAGNGRLAPKRAEAMGSEMPGAITRFRRHARGWEFKGPLPFALSIDDEWSELIRTAMNGEDVQVDSEAVALKRAVPDWIPQKGEELCNLVGAWRILQRVGSHRWTTDDLVTACIAYQEVSSAKMSAIQYLDLGTGNASVLQMVTWALLKDKLNVQSTGVEARLEAVQLARRSLSFNLGSEKPDARIVHGDFRDSSLSEKFDLITGTPPYFRVNFAVNDKDEIVTSAVINQGGMPTARQSAPARCEFRGGIEAYCEAAARVLKPSSGRFVVCENWLNHNRVVEAAANSGMQILTRTEVKGREGRETLFCVYVMRKVDTDEEPPITLQQSLTVRDRHGNWTDEYASAVLEVMSIPAVATTPRDANLCGPAI